MAESSLRPNRARQNFIFASGDIKRPAFVAFLHGDREPPAGVTDFQPGGCVLYDDPMAELPVAKKAGHGFPIDPIGR